MTIERKQNRKQVINLDSPEGNAYVLLGFARNISKQLGLDGDKISEEMKSGDYYTLVKVFDHYFGDYIILESDNEDTIEGVSNAQLPESCHKNTNRKPNFN